MKKYLTLCILTIMFGWISAKQVESNTAKVVARNFLTKRIKSVSLKNVQTLDLVYTISSKATNSTVNYFYVFNINGNQGFIIVSADDNATPILSYSDERGFDPNNIAPSCAKYLEKYKSEIRHYISNNGVANDNTNSEWSDLINGTEKGSNLKSLNSVSPLLNTTWNQNPFYNDQCPYDAASSSRCVTGCVACAMAQIMKYWSYPPQGFGFTSYSDPNYGTQSANFGATTYNWANMPNSISADNTEIETLMYQCGVAVNMQYGTASSGGSDAYVITTDNPICAQSAYTTYFGYDPSAINGVKRNAYQETDWITLLENELNNSRPVQYAGFGSGGGHTWVLDGYDNNNLFHMNWGWGNFDDGYFSIDALNPASGGTGGGSGDFNSNEEALIGIQPLVASAANIQLYSAISVTPDPLNFEQGFTVTANVINNGSVAYNGYYCAALFDDAGNFIRFIGWILQTSSPLPTGQYYSGAGLTFVDTTGVTTIPGSYTIGVYYEPTGGSNWILAGTSSYTNPITITMNAPSDSLTLYSNIAVTPASLIHGKPITITANVWNHKAYTLYAQYAAFLLNLAGDTTVEEIGPISPTALPSNGVYTSPGLSFTASGITAPPGSYQLAIGFKPAGSSNWYYVGGSSQYNNPIKVTVVAPIILPDVYEPDNTLATAYVFPVNFSGNTANVTTSGSNCHIGTDYDYYEINLAPGYDYTIASKLDDSYWSGNGQTYTLDAVASYSTDTGNTWSDAYNGGVIPNFVIHGGGKVYFWVSPYFVGQIGTYLLEMAITRAVCTVTSSITPSGTYYICQGSSLNLTATPGSGYTYQWQLNGTNISQNGSSQSYAATQSGNYTVIVISSGCSSISNNELTLNLRSGPTAEISAPSTAGFTPLTVNFSDNSLNTPTQWEWMFQGGTPSTSNSQNPSVTYNVSGLFDVSLKAINGCGSDSITKVNYVNVLSTGIQDNSFLRSVSVFPNPTNGNFSLIAELNNAQKMKISIFNPIGQIVYSNETDGTSSSINMTFDLSNYARGLYLLKLSTAGSLNCIKILIQ